MIKLYIFESVEDARAFDADQPHARPEARPEPEPEAEEPEPEAEIRTPRKYKKRKNAKRVPAKGNARGKGPSCSNCGGRGHNAKTCTEPKKTPIERMTRSGGTCFCGREAGHRGVHRGQNSKAKPKQAIDKSETGGDIEEDDTPRLYCHVCDEDHLTRDCPDFASKVAEMRAQGMDSLQIASKLAIRLKDIPAQ
jgi:hypothetical protein